MAIKVIAQRREVKLGKNPGMKFVMRPDLYIPIAEKKVFAEASTHSGISAGVIKAAWDAAGEVLRTWATEGHSVPLPGLGTMRFGVRSKAVANLEDVKTSLITTRRIVFTPSVDVNDELKNIAQIEHSRHRCFDNFMVNLLAALAAYCFFPKKPTIRVQTVDCSYDRQLTLF